MKLKIKLKHHSSCFLGPSLVNLNCFAKKIRGFSRFLDQSYVLSNLGQSRHFFSKKKEFSYPHVHLTDKKNIVVSYWKLKNNVLIYSSQRYK